MKALLNPWVILGAVVLLGATNAASYWRGGVNKEHAMEAASAREERLANTVYNKALSATAKEISKIEVRHVTINRKLEKEVRTNQVYLDCVHTDAGLGLLNDALSGGEAIKPADRGRVSALDAAGGQDLRSDFTEAR